MTALYGQIPSEELILYENELSARLGYRASPSEPTVSRIKDELISVCEVKYGARLFDVEYAGDAADFGFVKIPSSALIKNLRSAPRAYIFAVTLGMGVDRLIKEKALLSPSEGFIADAVASALAESACDLAEEKIRAGATVRPRFSPGYADFSLEFQRPILSALDSEKKIGIALLDSGLMIPQKSITAVLGIEK